MGTYTASIFVEVEIRVSGTLPSSDPSGWEDITVEGIVSHAMRLKDGKLRRLPFELADAAALLPEFTDNLAAEFSEEIEAALSAEVPDGPDPDDARDAARDRRLVEGEA